MTARATALLRAAMVLMLLAGSLIWVTRTPGVGAAAPSASLPRHFGIGLQAGDDNTGIKGWMPNSGIPFDYAWTYLSQGWDTTWSVSTPGRFALDYANDAASRGYLPVFDYYTLNSYAGSCTTCTGRQQTLSNLNNPRVMRSYYANFRLLMQRLGTGTYDGLAGYGKTAIVHVEPDTSGFANQAVLDNAGACYGLCTGQGNNPAFLKASVANSGDPSIGGFPDTYQGFNWALLHLRDLYAPNVLLAFNVSLWATGTDIGSDARGTLDPAALGQQAGRFAVQAGMAGQPSGVSSYDLVFNDPEDHDAGWQSTVNNTPNAWWDRLNVTFPNFHRWEAYLQAIHQTTGRPLMVWQVPVANQYFDTENNTLGHYQDNRAEYIFSHIGELAQSGLIAALFGQGADGGNSQVYDARNDGVTNPAPFCTTLGMSSGHICNDRVSTVSDDDGGYLRMAAQHYYASGPYSLDVTPTLTAVPSALPATPTAAPATPSATRPPAPPTATPIPSMPIPPTTTATTPAPNTPASPTATATRPALPPTAIATLTTVSLMDTATSRSVPLASPAAAAPRSSAPTARPPVPIATTTSRPAAPTAPPGPPLAVHINFQPGRAPTYPG